MSFFLELSIRPIEFGAASSVNAVFFDETNSEVISVNNDAEIVINSQNYARYARNVKLQPHGAIYAIKSSIQNTMLAVQRSHLAIDIFQRENRSGVADSSIAPSNKMQIHSFYWMPNDQICIITNKSIELFQLFAQTLKTKLLFKQEISVSAQN